MPSPLPIVLAVRVRSLHTICTTCVWLHYSDPLSMGNRVTYQLRWVFVCASRRPLAMNTFGAVENAKTAYQQPTQMGEAITRLHNTPQAAHTSHLHHTHKTAHAYKVHCRLLLLSPSPPHSAGLILPR